ncbi:cation diffusion facilitator family transporter [Aggregatibacter actinomycetemcomitans]|uniref:cation diffusion facilitator family transporter n=1 Tax=Aggregatibacter actinomycetemcomitans TaxID=714 RepID=UPI00022AD262|nr:cation diffusion facilitator family transporter [Aggregatibacter actinomycetemcomitans]KOE64785.1 ferrous iron transporter [Aggregatibacter actinomycetemcomitans serotype e str. SCC393]KOE67629.1 ferrous iron transporter [Aggregatibacter actinomycetemcomitans serotype e str. A160]KYK79833.1 iron transporter [Aggregatibacter actinomycetemcomitans serotype e str. SA2876]
MLAVAYSAQVKKAAHFAIITALILILAKGIAWWQTGSVSILASITDSMLDLLASFMNMLILRFALMPADHNHSFGHGKAESLASLVQSAFISGSAIFLLLQGIHRFNSPQALTNTSLGIVVTLFSILATALLVLYQTRVIKQTDSPAIKADRLHYQTDLLMNVAILISLGLSAYGVLLADAVFAILTALYILLNAAKMLFDSVQLLLDQMLPSQEIEQINALLTTEIAEDRRILGFYALRTRRSGAIRFIQFHLELADELSFIDAHDITEHLERQLQRLFPRSDIVIHPEPTIVVQREMQVDKKVI